MQIKNGVIIDGIVYERVLGENLSLRRIGKLKDILLYEHEGVDLGLSVKWASCNIGAVNPFDSGLYFAWGETKIKSSYMEDNCVTESKEMGSIVGNPTYDAARTFWGDTWRLPTKEEIDELVSKCKFEWATQGGHKGYKVTGPNGNSIFLPAAGWYIGMLLIDDGKKGYYWSGAPFELDTTCAYYLEIGSDGFVRKWDGRYYGQSIRPVTE